VTFKQVVSAVYSSQVCFFLFDLMLADLFTLVLHETDCALDFMLECSVLGDGQRVYETLCASILTTHLPVLLAVLP
jgi:hypothetical protein